MRYESFVARLKRLTYTESCKLDAWFTGNKINSYLILCHSPQTFVGPRWPVSSEHIPGGGCARLSSGQPVRAWWPCSAQILLQGARGRSTHSHSNAAGKRWDHSSRQPPKKISKSQWYQLMFYNFLSHIMSLKRYNNLKKTL